MVYKMRSWMDPRNYCGISVLSFRAKLYDSTLNSIHWTDGSNQGLNNQELRKKCSCCEQLQTLRFPKDFACYPKQSLFITFEALRQAYNRLPCKQHIELLQQLWSPEDVHCPDSWSHEYKEHAEWQLIGGIHRSETMRDHFMLPDHIICEPTDL